MPEPRIVVMSSLFPSPARPNAGVFIRERMFRVAKHLPVTVVSPQPWFPGQGLIRRFRPGYRPAAPRHEIMDGIDVFRPRFLSVPGIGRSLDGLSMAVCTLATVQRLRRERGVNLIDAHFAHPDGEAAVRIGRWLKLPVAVTLRGTEVPHSRQPQLRPRISRTLQQADRVFSVSDSLRQLALELGASPERMQVIGNGVDLQRFFPVDRTQARRALNLAPSARVLISVGGLVERKGMHRVIECLPALVAIYPDLVYLIVGGPSPEGDLTAELQDQVVRAGLQSHVRFLGPLAPDALRAPLSAADVFVLATRNEGWANVFLEAMACGLPVVTTDVGGNREVVCSPELGMVVPFGDAVALTGAIDAALSKHWDPAKIRAYAEDNAWDHRIATLVAAYRTLVGPAA